MLEQLWQQLDSVLAQMEPLKVQERAIRAKIKIAQDDKYLAIMGPKLDDLKKKLAQGKDVGATIKQIEYLQEKKK